MKSIEDIKIELTLKMLQGSLDQYDIEKLPKNDELRSFICQFEPRYAYCYASLIDEAPHPETRTAACKDPEWAYIYAVYVDGAPNEETRIAAYKDPRYAYCYAFYVDRAPSEEAKKAICKSPKCFYWYQDWEQKYNEKH